MVEDNCNNEVTEDIYAAIFSSVRAKFWALDCKGKCGALGAKFGALGAKFGLLEQG